MNRLKLIIIAFTTLTMLSACVNKKSYNFREVATNPYKLAGSRARIVTTDNQTIVMDVESIQGNHLYGDGQYVPISVIKSATTTKRGLPSTEGITPPVRFNEMSSFIGAFIVLTFPVLIILGVNG